MKKVLCVAPHPDDETLGCGGTLLKHKKAGDKIYWMIMTNMFGVSGYSAARIKERQKEIDRVAKAYGFSDVFKLDFPAAQLDRIPRQDIIGKTVQAVEKVKPDTIYLPGEYDAHSDHHVTFNAVMSVTKKFRAPYVKKVLMCEIISETEFAPLSRQKMFVPNSLSDISAFLEKKIRIMRMFKGEMGKHPFPRSEKNIRALALHRGAMAGVKYAEAFMMIKEIW